MSNENASTTDDQTGESPNVKRMREQIDALKAENEALSARTKLSAFKEAGLDPEKGIGKAVYRTYDGEISPDSIATFARDEYDWQPQAPGVSESQQRMTALGSVGSAPPPRNRMQEAEKASSEGDWTESARLKDAELLAITQKRHGVG